LVVYPLSRLARNTRDVINLADRLNWAGADLGMFQENVNTHSSMERFIFTLFLALAQLEREQIGAYIDRHAPSPRVGAADSAELGGRVDEPDRAADSRHRPGTPSK
jgi:hypothetical protein